MSTRTTSTLAVTAAAAAALALAACNQATTTSHPKAKASAKAEGSALATTPAALAAQAHLRGCVVQASKSGDPIIAFHTCFRHFYPKGQGRALLTCFGPAVFTYYTHPRTTVTLSVLNGKISTCVVQHP